MFEYVYGSPIGPYLYAKFYQATNAGEATLNVLSTIREKLLALQSLVQGLSSQTEEIEMVNIVFIFVFQND